MCQQDDVRLFFSDYTYIANTPCHRAFFAGCRGLICLTLNAYVKVSAKVSVRDVYCPKLQEGLTKIHNVVSADGAVIDDNIPRPQRHGIPLVTI